MYKLLVATAAVAFASVGAANAADMPLKAPPLAPPVASWTGCYVDAGAGYGFWNQEHRGETFPGLVPLTADVSSGGQGWLGRFGGGCDYQYNPKFVIGAFGDYDVMNLKSTNFADVGGVGSHEKESGSWALGIRVGYLPYPDLMTFVSGGWTQARFDRQELFSTFFFPAVALGAFMPARTYSGGFIGGGYEYRLPWLQNVTWKTEYRYNWYGAEDLPILVDVGAVATGVGEHSQKTVQTVTTSLVWRFNWGGPLFTRY